jgi:hypothetical protein
MTARWGREREREREGEREREREREREERFSTIYTLLGHASSDLAYSRPCLLEAP